jgi:hypothetical protein
MNNDLTLIRTLTMNMTCRQAKQEENTMKASLSASRLVALSPVKVTTACHIQTKYKKIMLPRIYLSCVKPKKNITAIH